MKLDGIAGKVAIVTGAGGGIGEAYAKGLAGQGARVVVAEALAGARASSYVQTATGSRVDATRRELRAAGVLVAQN